MTATTFDPGPARSNSSGETTKRMTVDIVDDHLDEPDESFTVELTNPQNATIDGEGTGTIVDDDHAPVLTRLQRSQTPEALETIAL